MQRVFKGFCCVTCLMFALVARPARAQQTQPSTNAPDVVDAVAQSIDDWLKDNIDEDVLAVLPEIDRDKLRNVLKVVEERFQGTNIYALGPLKESAEQMIPVLEQYEETQPYAIWLKTRLDYIETSRDLAEQTKPIAPRPGQTPVLPRPTPQLEKKVWVTRVEKSPPPAMAQQYLPALKKAFAEEGVPTELVWVAEVESSFDPRARSPAGAAGLFQLMPATAREHDLSLWPWDERFQPEKSAHAAAKELKRLHGHYRDWQLAVAAYNVGQGRLDKFLKQRKARSFDAISDLLPTETQMYVPKVEAVVRKREGVALADLKMPKG